MVWTTLYIKGKPGFEAEVLRHLGQSEVAFMPGLASGQANVSLFWVDENASIRDFKKAIGSKVIFKYRLVIFSNMDTFGDIGLELQDSFTPQEEALVRSMSHWQENRKYKHSA